MEPQIGTYAVLSATAIPNFLSLLPPDISKNFSMGPLSVVR